MRRLIILTAALALAACGGSDGISGSKGPPVATTSVTLKNIAFAPGAIQVTPGATVQFTNNDGIAHNVTFDAGSITGATDFTSGTRSVAMPVTPGTYTYRCTIHSGMTGSVVVQ
jgi:plastocyanin